MSPITLGINRMSGRTIIRRFIHAAVAYAVVWLVCFVESMICETAWGGPFTILVSFILKFVFAGLAVTVALAADLLLLIPGVRDLWRRVGYWSLLLSVAALAVTVFASKLGLRTVDPVFQLSDNAFRDMVPLPCGDRIPYRKFAYEI